MTQTLTEILNDAEELIAEYHPLSGKDAGDITHEIADGQVPVYTADLMALAAHNIYLAVDEPELGPAFDGTPTPVNIIAANVYERVYDHVAPLVQDAVDKSDEWEGEDPAGRLAMLQEADTDVSIFCIRRDQAPVEVLP